jgi:hypothetical protein
MGTGALSPVLKRPGRKSDQSRPPSAEVKNQWSTLPLPHTPPWHAQKLYTIFMIKLNFKTDVHKTIKYYKTDCEILGSHSGAHRDAGHFRRYVVFNGKQLTFRRR